MYDELAGIVDEWDASRKESRGRILNRARKNRALIRSLTFDPLPTGEGKKRAS